MWSLVNARDVQYPYMFLCVVVRQYYKMKRRGLGLRLYRWTASKVSWVSVISKMDEALNARIRKLCGMTKGVDERIDESVLQWFDQAERIENDRITKRVYVGEFTASRSVGKPRKRGIDIVKDCLKKRSLDVTQGRRMMPDRNEWQWFVRGNA